MGEDEELEDIRNKKLKEMQSQARMQEAQENAYEEQKAQIEAKRQAIMRQILTPKARERLGTLKTVKPDFVRNVEDQLIMLVESGRLNQVVDDKTLKDILIKLQPDKRDFKIDFR